MASIAGGVTTDPLEKKSPTMLRCAPSRPRIWRLRRKKKLPTVRLGSGQSQLQGGGSGSLMVRMIRRIRVRWLKLKKACALKKLKEYYVCVLKDLTENDGSLEKRRQMLLMESSFGIPVMGLTFNAYN